MRLNEKKIGLKKLPPRCVGPDVVGHRKIIDFYCRLRCYYRQDQCENWAVYRPYYSVHCFIPQVIASILSLVMATVGKNNGKEVKEDNGYCWQFCLPVEVGMACIIPRPERWGRGGWGSGRRENGRLE